MVWIVLKRKPIKALSGRFRRGLSRVCLCLTGQRYESVLQTRDPCLQRCGRGDGSIGADQARNDKQALSSNLPHFNFEGNLDHVQVSGFAAAATWRPSLSLAQTVATTTKTKHGCHIENKGMDMEVVAKPDVLQVYVSDHGKPLKIEGWQSQNHAVERGRKIRSGTLAPAD
jgi:hypothetical protein